MIEARDLTKNYGPVRALRGVTLTIEPGQVVGLLGPNGAGKSTLMRIVTGFLAPTAGSVRVNGVEVMDDPTTCQRQIGYLPEGNPLYLDMRLREILRFTADVRGLAGDERRHAITEAIQDAGLRGKEGKLVSALSRGYRQRVGLAMALLHRPAILILDEPSSGLDPNQQAEMRNFIRRLGESRTVVFSTHILPEVEAICDRVVIVNEGEIVADGTVDEVRAQAAAAFGVAAVVRGDAAAARGAYGSLAFVDDTEVEKDTEGEGLVRVHLRTAARAGQAELEAVARATLDAGLGLVQLDSQLPSLDEAFAKLTAERVVATEAAALAGKGVGDDA